MRACSFIIVLMLGLICQSGIGADSSTTSSQPSKNPELAQRLPALERLADQVEAELKPFLESKDEKVLDAVDGAHLRVMAVRSARRMLEIADGPAPANEDFHNRAIYNTAVGHLERVSIRMKQKCLEEWQEGLAYYLQCAKDGTDPYKGMIYGMRSVRSPIDGQLLWYEYWLPKDYSPQKKYPLEVRLHSGAELMWQATWVMGRPATEKNLPARAASLYWDHDVHSLWKGQSIWVHPCGRGNNDYAWMGEAAVMQVIEHVKKTYSVDEDLVTGWGGSMGADGMCRLAALHPDVFARATILSGGIYGWPKKVVFDPSRLADNFANVPLAIPIGGKDGYLKGVAPFVADLDRLAKEYPGYYPHQYRVDPPKGHENLSPEIYKELDEWMFAQKPRNRWPKLVAYKTECLRYDGAYWATIDTVDEPTEPARIVADARTAGSVRVTVQNVTRFHLDLAKELVGDMKETRVSVNGGPAITVPAGVVHFAKEGGEWTKSDRRYPAGLVKRHGLSGPISDAFMEHPVLMVYPTQGGANEKDGQRQIDNFVRYYFGPGDGYEVLHTPFDRRADAEVSDQDIAQRNLVIFGDPGKNKLLARMADKLPGKYTADDFEIGGKSYKNATHGLMMVYPNPLNPERYLVLVPEVMGRCDALGVSHVSLDLCYLGDWAVIEPQKHWPEKLWAMPVAGGSFDSRWEMPQPTTQPTTRTSQ